MNRWLCALVVFAGLSVEVRAAHVAYSWTGTIVDSVPGTFDPWNVGFGGESFSLAIMVDQLAIDRTSSIQIASFDILALEFAKNGAPASTVAFDSSRIIFDDGAFGGAVDAIKVSFFAEFNGHTDHLSSTIVLPANTFGFLLIGAAPPLFDSAIAPSGAQSQGSGSLFAMIVGAGIEATSIVVPEPSTYALAAIGVIGLLAFRRRTH
jgi:hypothetical protein